MKKSWPFLFALILYNVAGLLAGPRPAAAPAWPANFEDWVVQRVGPVVYPTAPRPKTDWDPLIDLNHELGARAVKTWLGGAAPGEAFARLQTPPYHRLAREHDVIHINVCLNYVTQAYIDNGNRLDNQTLDAAREEWRRITRHLCELTTDPQRIFLLSVGAELNVYLGTAQRHPDFPVDQLVNTAHQGKEQALAELNGRPRPQVYTVAEFQGEVEFEAYARKWAPRFETDLISLSYYTFFRPLDDSLTFLRSITPARGPFGADRLMLGEYGLTHEVCNWNQAAHARWHLDMLRQAFDQHAQFAFYYSLADDPGVIRDAGHDGLIGWTRRDDPGRRLTWFLYHALYHRQPPLIPDYELYEYHDELNQPAAGDAPNFVLENLTVLGAEHRPGDAVAFRVTVRNAGPAPAPAASVNFYVNDRIVAYAGVPALEPGAQAQVESTATDPRFVWSAQAGTHRLAAHANVRHGVPELAFTDNEATIYFTIAADEP